MGIPREGHHPHLVRPGSGLGDELWVLRQQVATALAAVDVLITQATETARGTAEIATQAEADAGTDDLRIITALKLASLQRLNPLWIPSPVTYNADRTFLQLWNAKEGIALFNPTATRKLDPRTVTSDMAGTIWKTGTGAFGLTIDVTSGGNQGWTTPDGLNTDYTLVNSALAQAGSWLYVIDKTAKIISVTPVV